MNGNVSSAVRFTDARVYNSIHLTGGGERREGRKGMAVISCVIISIINTSKLGH